MSQLSGTYQIQNPLDLSKIVADPSWTDLTNIAKENQWYLEIPMEKIFAGFPNIKNIYFNITELRSPGFSSQVVNKMYRGMPIPMPGGLRKEGNDNIISFTYNVDANFIQFKILSLWWYLNEFVLRRETINAVSLALYDESVIGAYCGLAPAVDMKLFYFDDKKRITFIREFLQCFPNMFGEQVMRSGSEDNLVHTVDFKFFIHRDYM